MSADWPFEDPENVAVFTLGRIVRGEALILLVTHDEDDGGWQFLDGGEVAVADAALVSLREMARIDPGILELADLPVGWVAERAGPGEPWQRSPARDEGEREPTARPDSQDYEWTVYLIPEDDEGPAFAYSVGLFQAFGHPEVVVFGLDIRVMHAIINLIGEEVRRGRRFAEGEAYSEFLEGHDVRFLQVARRHYPEYFGRGTRFYRGDEFPVLQCLWPDRAGRFPTDPVFPEALRGLQPLLAP